MGRKSHRQKQRLRQWSRDAAQGARVGVSQPARPALSPSVARPAGSIDLLERFDGFAGLRNGLREIAESRGDWAGIPMPLEDLSLTVEPTYPGALELMAMGMLEKEPASDFKPKVRNQFWSWKYRCEVVIYENDGKIEWAPLRTNRLDYELKTLGATYAWGIEQESNAVRLLATLLPHHQFKKYLLCGMFTETSPRSGVTYLFRKLRPTIALTLREERIRILCALCMHPIGYYQGSWAGAMTPTDDVVAHLQMMRGDEHLFWRRSNQHAAFESGAGIG